MTITQFFKKYPGAQEVLKVGDNLFFVGYEASARSTSLRVGLPLERISRPVKAEKSKKEEGEPEAKPSQSES